MSPTRAEFADKNVLVTGAAGTLGRVVAARFHEVGAVVTGVDVVEHEASWRTFAADLTDPRSAQAAVAAAGDVQVLANIAGGFTMGETVADTRDETWDFMLNLNARTVLNMCRAAVPGMLARGRGKIINIGAQAGLRGVAAMGAYVASKSIVLRLTETLSEEIKHRGVNVNCVLPNIIDTPRNRADMPDADYREWASPAAIAEVILFLASPGADAIHGTLVPVEARREHVGHSR